jgi:hypothetical protein
MVIQLYRCVVCKADGDIACNTCHCGGQIQNIDTLVFEVEPYGKEGLPFLLALESTKFEVCMISFKSMPYLSNLVVRSKVSMIW